LVWDSSWPSSVYPGKRRIIASDFAMTFQSDCSVVAPPCSLYTFSYLAAPTEHSDNRCTNSHWGNNLIFQVYY
jgi:hypothetical protein